MKKLTWFHFEKDGTGTDVAPNQQPAQPRRIAPWTDDYHSALFQMP